jgi:surfactin synthase thioesterase subunit
MLTVDNLVSLTARPQPAARLVCFPHAGAGAAAFKMWIEPAADDVEVLAVRLPGRENLFDQAPLSNMREIGRPIGDVLAELSAAGPVGLFGYCAGAFAAFEAARRMTEQQAPPALLAVCSQVAPQVNAVESPVHALPSNRLRQLLRTLGGTDPLVLDHEEFWALAEPALRADYAAAETYWASAEPKLSCDIITFRGDGDQEVTAPKVEAWSQVTTGAHVPRLLDGGHFLLQSQAAEVLAEVQRHLLSLPPAPSSSLSPTRLHPAIPDRPCACGCTG